MGNKLIPVVHEEQRVLTTEQLAQVYETDTNNIKNNFNNHKDNFKEGIHYFLLKGDILRAFKHEVNDIDLVAPNVNQLYLWTERGANRHCKILDTPKAWEQFDNLEETYFMAKEQRKRQKAVNDGGQAARKLHPLPAFNTAIKLAVESMRAAGVAEEYIVETMRNSYRPYGINIPDDCVTVKEHFMSQTDIAQKLGVMTRASSGKNPSSAAIGAIIAQIEIADSEVKNAPFTRNGHSGDSKLYSESVVGRIADWLRDHGYPATIKGENGRNQYVVYREAA